MANLLRGRLPEILELVGAVCLTVAAAHVAAGLAWAVVGAALVGKSYELDSRPRPTRRGPDVAR
ncbi:MAG TPA: hypothetical protein VGR26_14995 [Acidimicrobiales bacterium]|nr:hypothetical protein [Acidimicrobiales bacterium]